MTKPEGGGAGDRVLLLHGFGALPLQTAPLARHLRRAGYAVLNPLYPSWRWPLERIVDHLSARVAAFAAEADRLHCVGHSMGGLVLRALLAQHRPNNLGRVVMLGTPHGGSELADLAHRLRLHGPILNRAGRVLRTARHDEVQAMLGRVDYPLGIIAGDRPFNPLMTDPVFRTPHDGKVSVASSHVEGETDHLVLPVNHTGMLYSRAVFAQTAHFLAQGHFVRP